MKDTFDSKNWLSSRNFFRGARSVLLIGCEIRKELRFTCIFDQISKQEAIDLLNNTETVIDRILSVAAKFIIND